MLIQTGRVWYEKIMTLQTQVPVQRIAVLSVHTSPLAALGAKKTGGMNVYVRDFCREMARRGVAVDVFTRIDNPDLPLVTEDKVAGFRVIHVAAGPQRVIPNDNIAPFLDQFGRGVLDYAATHSLTYDLIHSHYWLSGLVGDQMRRGWGGVPLVHMYHTLGHMKNQIASGPGEFASAARLDGEHYIARHADRLIAATPSEAAQLESFYHVEPECMAVLPPGVDLNRFQPVAQSAAKAQIGIAPDERLILFVGRIEPLKGIDTLLRAVSLLRDRYPQVVADLHVAIVGGDPHSAPLDDEMARLQAMHRELDLRALVKFLGAKSQDVLPAYYAAAEMVVMPSHYESFGMVGLEAMAMGTPVVASRVGGLAHLVRDAINGYLVPPRTPEALAARILHLLIDESHRQLLGEQARQYACQYAWPIIVDQMLDIYSDLVEPKLIPVCC